jgi:hypothetical protein
MSHPLSHWHYIVEEWKFGRDMHSVETEFW